MPENLWVEIGVLFKSLKEKRKAVGILKQNFDISIHRLGKRTKRRWLEATVHMQNKQEEEALDEIAKNLGDKVDGWLDVWVHSQSRHIGSTTT